jgi:hypothetical protein
VLDAGTDTRIHSSTSSVVAQLISTAPTAFPPRGQAGPGMHETLRPTLIQVHVDLLYAILGLNQRRTTGDENVRYAGRLSAARGLARIATSINNSTRVYSHIPLVVRTMRCGMTVRLLTGF